MTREDFIARWRHEIDGWVLDAAMEGRHGAELSVWLRTMRGKIESKLGVMFDSLQTPVASNGPVQQKGGGR